MLTASAADPAYLHSVLRERIVEHVFTGEVLRSLWRRGVTDVEVLRSEFDAGGYDLVMARGDVVRHIQLKASIVEGARAAVTISMKLLSKPSGCVLWIVVTDKLEFVGYRWFGGTPGKPLPDIATLKMAKHAKGDATGKKNPRPDHRIVPKSRFEALRSIDQVLERLFGPL
jgi:hypothetical protein